MMSRKGLPASRRTNRRSRLLSSMLMSPLVLVVTTYSSSIRSSTVAFCHPASITFGAPDMQQLRPVRTILATTQLTGRSIPHGKARLGMTNDQRSDAEPKIFDDQEQNKDEQDIHSTNDWQVLNRIMTMQTPWMTLIAERLRDPVKGGLTMDYWRVEKEDSVVIVTIHQNHFVLPKPMYRPGIGRATLDFPGGRVPATTIIDDNPSPWKGDETPESKITLRTVAKGVICRELGITDMDIDSLVPLNQQKSNGGWPVNSSFSNQQLWGYIAILKDSVELDASRLWPQRYEVTPEGIGALLCQLSCLQCRHVLLEWLRVEHNRK